MKIFNRARLTLAVWYLVLITAISILFSFLIYRVQIYELNRFAYREKMRLESRFGTGPGIVIIDESYLIDAKERIASRLIMFNILVMVMSGGVGYFLAGRTLQPIEDMVAEQRRFVSDAAHELRTPLTAIKSSLEVYKRDPHPTKHDTALLVEDNLADVDRLEQLSSSLLTLSHLQHSDGASEMVQLNLSEVAVKAIKSLEGVAKNKNVSLVTDLEKGIMVYGSPSRLRELITILVENAIKYSHGDNKQVIFSLNSIRGRVYLSVKDNGLGIDKRDLPHIFDRFYRSDSARTKSSQGGFGLGLAIAKKIVENHRGVIKVHSKLGAGSEFVVEMPLSV